MYKKTLITSMLASIIFGSAPVQAEDFVTNTIKATPSLKTTDEGVQAIIDTQSLHAPVPEKEAYVPASDLIAEILLATDYKREGWHKEKGIILATADVSWQTEDPAFDPDFISKRALFSTRALMSARIQIAEYMRSNMTAKDLLKSPPNSAMEQLSREHSAAERQFNAQKKQVAKLLARHDKQEAKAVNGATWDQQGKALLNSIIKKLDESYDVSQIEENNKEKFEQTKRSYQEAVDKLTAIENQVEDFRGADGDGMCSNVALSTSGALLGTTQLATAEAWDPVNKRYEISSLVIWSPKLRKSAEALLAGQVEKLKGKKGKTLESWLDKQNLSTLLGTRQLVDEKGDRWFIGVSAVDFEGSSARLSAARRNAGLFAAKEAIMSAYANMNSNKAADACAQDRVESIGYSRTDFASSSAEETSQFVENLQISGGSPVLKKAVIHPLTNSKMYVVVYAISADAAAAGMAAEKNNIASAINVEKYQNKRRGEKAGLDQAIAEARDSKAEYNQGKKSAYKEVSEKATSNQKLITKQERIKINKSKTGAGTIVNTEEIDDDDF